MSPNINSFVGDLVEMARAMEELPTVKAALLQMQNANLELSDAIAHREERIIELKAEIEAKASTIRSLEVARDDAELRFLEADEKLQGMLVDARNSQAILGGLISRLDPPKPEPVMQAQPVDPKPEPTVHEHMDEFSKQGIESNTGMVDPKDESASPSPLEGSSSIEPLGDNSSQSSVSVSQTGNPSNVDSWASGPGQSEADPIAAGTETTEPVSVYSVSATSQDSVATTEPKPSGRYSGKRYYDWATYVSLINWLAEGGTEEDYNWRPAGSTVI